MAQPQFPPTLYTMHEVADICGRSYQHLRRTFGLGLAPEPRHVRTFVRNGQRCKQRKWTRAEALSLRKWFAAVEYGSLRWRTVAARKAAR